MIAVAAAKSDALQQPFSDQDAQLIVNHAMAAPHANLASATELAVALAKFQGWFKLACQAVQKMADDAEVEAKRLADELAASVANQTHDKPPPDPAA